MYVFMHAPPDSVGQDIF